MDKLANSVIFSLELYALIQQFVKAALRRNSSVHPGLEIEHSRPAGNTGIMKI